MMWVEILMVAVLVLAIAPFFLLGNAFRGAKKGAPGLPDGAAPASGDGLAKKSQGHDRDGPGDLRDSGMDSGSGEGGDGGGGGGK